MRIAHICDFHLPANPNKKVNGVSPHENLKAAVGELRRQSPKVDLVILGGDLLEEGEKGNYQSVLEHFGELQVPLHVLLGNHDHLPTFRKTSGLPLEGDFPGYLSFDHLGSHFVLLHSAGTGKAYGRLDERQLLWLNADLHAHRHQSVLIFLHHPPFETGIGWLDKIRLLNAENLWEVIPPYARNIRGLFAGHLHMAMAVSSRRVLLASAPAVCWQYSAAGDASKPEVSRELPGFNLIDVSDAQISVRTVRFVPALSQGAEGAPGTLPFGAPSAGERPGGASPSPSPPSRGSS